MSNLEKYNGVFRDVFMVEDAVLNDAFDKQQVGGRLGLGEAAGPDHRLGGHLRHHAGCGGHSGAHVLCQGQGNTEEIRG